MKTNLFLLVSVCLLNVCIGQKTTGNIYIFKKDGNPAADVKEAAFLQHIFPLNDTTYLSRYYNFAGSMISQESYLDSNLTIPNGRFCWYNKKGKLDSTGLVNRGRKDGDWDYVISKNETRSITYDNGIKTNERTFHYDDNGKYISTDTSHDKKEDKTQAAAKYKKGDNSWATYCQENLHTPERLQNVLGDGTHTCTVSFLVDKKGYTRDIYLTESCEWSGDAEVMRLIAESPQWQPAIQKSEPVFYRQLQSLSYQVSSR